MVLTFDQPVVLVGDAPISHDLIRAYDEHILIAVDGGANSLADAGLAPSFIAGDFDSIRPELLENFPQKNRYELSDQNFGDFEKTLQIIDAPKIYALGFLGGRFDHSFEALRVLSLYHELNLELVKEGETISIWKSGETRKMKIGQRVSYFSLADTHILESAGLQYPPDGLILGVLKRGVRTISLSNCAISEDVRVNYEGAPLVGVVET